MRQLMSAADYLGIKSKQNGTLGERCKRTSEQTSEHTCVVSDNSLLQFVDFIQFPPTVERERHGVPGNEKGEEEEKEASKHSAIAMPTDNLFRELEELEEEDEEELWWMLQTPGDSGMVKGVRVGSGAAKKGMGMG